MLATFPSNSSGQLPGLWRVGVTTFGSLFRAMGISRSSPRDVLTAQKDVPADGRDAVVKRAPVSKRKRQDPTLAKVLSPIEGILAQLGQLIDLASLIFSSPQHEETNMDSKGKVFKVATRESAIPAIELSDAVPAQEDATRVPETAKPAGKQSRKTTRGKKSAGDATPPMSPKTAKKDAPGPSSRSPTKSPSKKVLLGPTFKRPYTAVQAFLCLLHLRLVCTLPVLRRRGVLIAARSRRDR